MPWVRVDDQFTIHRKVAGLSDAAFRLHVSALCWCSRNLTDGFIPKEDLPLVAGRTRAPARLAAECVIRSLWHLGDEMCPSDKCPAPVDGDGWVIHDYLDYQFSADKIRRNREAKAARQRKWLEKVRGQKRDASHTPSIDASGDASIDLPPSPPRNKRGRAADAAPVHRGAANGRRPAPTGAAAAAARPPWCGNCNEQTRFTDDDPPKRCPACHPLTMERP